MIPKTYKFSKNPVFKCGKNYLKRVGRCDTTKCGSACCKFFYSRNYQFARYLAGFMGGAKIEGKGKDGAIIHKECDFLKEGRCTRWKTLPVPCYQFPIPSDDVYKAVKRVCGFRFVRITKKEYGRRIKKHGV